MANIWVAAMRGDADEVQRLVIQDPSLLDAVGDSRPSEVAPNHFVLFPGVTPLMNASEEGHVHLVRWLLDRGAAVNAHPHHVTALMMAAAKGHYPVVRLLLEGGGDPILASWAGDTPLIFASQEGHVEVVRSLLGHPSAETTINHRGCGGKTALFVACSKGREGIVRALLESGTDPSIAEVSSVTPLVIASREGHLEVVRVLLGHPIGKSTINHRLDGGQNSAVGRLLGGSPGRCWSAGLTPRSPGLTPRSPTARPPPPWPSPCRNLKTRGLPSRAGGSAWRRCR
jgi:ankyrin repeat protein